MNETIIKIVFFIAASLVFQIIAVIVIFITTYIRHEFFNEPNLISTCIKYDENYLDYCSQIDDVSKVVLPSCASSGWDGCLEKEYDTATVYELTIDEYRKWLPITALGLGLFLVQQWWIVLATITLLKTKAIASK